MDSRWCEQNDTQIQQNGTTASINGFIDLITSVSTSPHWNAYNQTGCLVRPECPPNGFTEEKIRELNSDKLPVRNWAYGSDGICEGGDAKNCLQSFIKLKEEPNIYVEITATPAKFASCTVRKSMSRILKQLSCMLTNP
ncbi:hypothetical protein M3Y96_00561200 [Aphelenchoides besseyi]|nr:hypothetical protein M3Y96_00561200 [Aphelenchoides besseyi]